MSLLTGQCGNRGLELPSCRGATNQGRQYPHSYCDGFRDGGDSLGLPAETGGAEWRLEGCPVKLTAMATTPRRLHVLVHKGVEGPSGLLYARAEHADAGFIAPIKMHPEAGTSDRPAMEGIGDTLLAV